VLLDGQFPAYEEDLIATFGIRPLDLDADFALRLIQLRQEKSERVITVERTGDKAVLTAAELGIWSSVWSDVYWEKKSGRQPKPVQVTRDRFELAADDVEDIEAMVAELRTFSPRTTGFGDDPDKSGWTVHQKGGEPVHLYLIHPQALPEQWLETVENLYLSKKYPPKAARK
jgi:hypothetical protein